MNWNYPIKNIHWNYPKLIKDLNEKITVSHDKDIRYCAEHFINMMEDQGRIHWADDKIYDDEDITKKYSLGELLSTLGLNEEDYLTDKTLEELNQ